MKRALDLILVILALPLWAPLFLLVAVLVLLCLGAPVFFRQERAGLGGKPFRIFKFRTMTNERDEAGRLLPDRERLRPCGSLLRSLSLDELPGLLNVLRGEMSLVGPRPLPTLYVSRYSPEQALRLTCMPGITGWAQVNGRNQLDWEDRFRHDLWYVRNQSLSLDLKILWLTISSVIRREGIAGRESVTMTEFMGSPPGPDPTPDSGATPPASPDPSRKSE